MTPFPPSTLKCSLDCVRDTALSQPAKFIDTGGAGTQSYWNLLSLLDYESRRMRAADWLTEQSNHILLDRVIAYTPAKVVGAIKYQLKQSKELLMCL